jgi:predicted amidohydrolase YtcJ
MNQAAADEYHFTPEECYPEAYWRILPEVLSDRSFIVPQFKRYMQMMNSRGVTSVKEMGFDDFYEFTDVLEELEKEQQLTLRVNFMSQPVGSPMNIEHGKAMKEKFKGDFVRFSGYNLMTAG